uniref:Uncharacterized protein n=1 Tax=Triticum urartu TaxID=4572 RepID=A0A8R7VAY5_TRIUA
SIASAAPGQKGDTEVRERRREKGGAVRRPRPELTGAGQRRTGATAAACLGWSEEIGLGSWDKSTRGCNSCSCRTYASCRQIE